MLEMKFAILFLPGLQLYNQFSLHFLFPLPSTPSKICKSLG